MASCWTLQQPVNVFLIENIFPLDQRSIPPMPLLLKVMQNFRWP
jgi:hypothetical protein